MKRPLSLILAALILASAMTACGNTEPSAETKAAETSAAETKTAETSISETDIAETPEIARVQNAASVAAVGYRMYLRGEITDAAALAPVYLRASQAERERNERLAAEKANEIQ